MMGIDIMAFEAIHSYLLEYIPLITDSFFSGNYLCLSLFIVSLCILFNQKNSIVRGKRLMLTYVLLALAFVLYNPLFYFASNTFGLTDITMFARFWLICPLWIILAFIGATLAGTNNKRAMTAMVITLILVFWGNTVESLKQMVNQNGNYKVASSSVELADEILLLNNEQPTSLYVFEPPHDDDRYENGGTLYYGIVQYSGDIMIERFIFSQERWDYYFVSDYIPGDSQVTSEEFIALVFDQYEINQYDYVAWPDDPRIISKMEYCGYSLVGHAGEYNIFAQSHG